MWTAWYNILKCILHYELPYCILKCKGDICNLSVGRLGKQQIQIYMVKNNPLYKLWIRVKGRCNNLNHCNYYKYGRIGIKMHEAWEKDFWQFYNYVSDLDSYPGDEEMGQGKWDLHRLWPKGHYEPGNVIWLSKEDHIEVHRMD